VAPKLLTVMKDGSIETEEVCRPVEDGACIAYAYAQSPMVEGLKQILKMKESSGENWPKAPYGDLVEPYIFERPDGTTALVQTWPTAFNDQWRDRFAERYPFLEPNPNPDAFEGVAADDFAIAMERAWNNGACTTIDRVSDKIKERIEYCVATAENDSIACIGDGRALIDFLKASDDARAEFNIMDPAVSTQLGSSEVTYSFISKCTYPHEPAKDAEDQTKLFNLYPDTRYVLYMKDGWERMACVKPEDQFFREAEWRTDGAGGGDDDVAGGLMTGLMVDDMLGDDDF